MKFCSQLFNFRLRYWTASIFKKKVVFFKCFLYRSDNIKLNISSKYPKKIPTMQTFMNVGIQVPEKMSPLSRKPHITIPLLLTFSMKQKSDFKLLILTENEYIIKKIGNLHFFHKTYPSKYASPTNYCGCAVFHQCIMVW